MRTILETRVLALRLDDIAVICYVPYDIFSHRRKGERPVPDTSV